MFIGLMMMVSDDDDHEPVVMMMLCIFSKVFVPVETLISVCKTVNS